MAEQSSAAGRSSEALRSFAAACEQAISFALQDEGLLGHPLDGWQGPRALTFRFALHQPTASTLARALRMGPAIEARLRRAPVRMYAAGGVVHVEVPSPWPVTWPAAKLEGCGLHVPLGLTGERDQAGRLIVAGVDFAKRPHLLAVGATGTGKTTALLATVYHLARQNHPGRARFVVLARPSKAETWQPVATLCHTLAVVTDAEESAACLRWLAGQADGKAGGPVLFAVVDDLLRLLDLADVAGELASIASLGREAGVRLLIGTQRVGKAGTGDAAVAGNIRDRLVFGAASAADAALFAGRPDTGAEKLTTAGDALLICGERVTRLAVSAARPSDWAALPQSQAEHRPWRTGAQIVSTAPQSTHSRVIPFPTPVSGTNRLAYRPPTAEDAAVIRRLFAEHRSLNKVARLCYGGKNSTVLAWLHRALGDNTEAEG